jgi:hypothetical protein
MSQVEQRFHDSQHAILELRDWFERPGIAQDTQYHGQKKRKERKKESLREQSSISLKPPPRQDPSKPSLSTRS